MWNKYEITFLYSMKNILCNYYVCHGYNHVQEHTESAQYH